ncbi:MAG: hypothetical protein D6726_11095 [Nitrospirae bacterium]|nr:MAG: hypothetical protein D6726_11095 [Nitrospirota bacterium]
MKRFLLLPVIVGFIIVTFPVVILAEDSSTVLATAGNLKITQEDLDESLKVYSTEIQNAVKANRQLQQKFLQRLVELELFSSIAREKGIDRIPAVKKRMEILVNDFLSKELLSREVVDKIKVSEEDMKQYYKANAEQFKKPEEVKARHILIKVKRDASEDEKKAARKKAEEILSKIKKGEDFASLAEKFSDDPGSAKRGGDLGFFSRGRMVKPFEDAAFSLKPGEVSGIVETRFGYHIIKVEEKKPASIQPFEAVKDTIKNELIKKVQNEKVKEYVQRVMKERKVKLYPERIKMN